MERVVRPSLQVDTGIPYVALSSLPHPQPQLAQLLGLYRAGRPHEEILSTLGFGEGNHVTQAITSGQHEAQLPDAEQRWRSLPAAPLHSVSLFSRDPVVRCGCGVEGALDVSGFLRPPDRPQARQFGDRVVVPVDSQIGDRPGYLVHDQ